MKNTFQLFCENKKLEKGKIITKIISLFFFSVSFFYFLIAVIKFYNTDGINIFEDKNLPLFIFFTVIFLVSTGIVVYSTLKNKDETEKIADFFEDIVLPLTGLGVILLGIENLDSIISLKGWILEGDPTEAYGDLLKGTYLIVTPLVWTIFYKAKVWWNKI